MTYSVTGVTATPDIAFKFGCRHTAEGARDLATLFLRSGLQEVEVRDDSGRIRSIRELDQIAFGKNIPSDRAETF